MKQKHHKPYEGKNSKCLWVVCLFFCMIATGWVQAASKVFAQTTVTATFKNASLSEVLWEIQRQTNFTFVYSTVDVKNILVKNLQVKEEKIADVLNKCLKDSGLTYSVENGVIAIKEADKAYASTEQKEITIEGLVIDETGSPVIGANIVVKGTTRGTTTGVDGHFTVKVENLPANLVISYIGYIKQEVKIEKNHALQIRLKPDSNLMEEVVVTGYGTFKKSAYAGSASTVKTGELKDLPAVSFTSMLEGNAPGVQITSASGQPGASTSIRIRGMGSFNARATASKFQ